MKAYKLLAVAAIASSTLFSCGKKCGYNGTDVPCDLMGMYDRLRTEKAKVDEFKGSAEEKKKVIEGFIAYYETKKDSLAKFIEATKKPSQVNWEETIAGYKAEMEAASAPNPICKKWAIDVEEMTKALGDKAKKQIDAIKGQVMDVMADGNFTLDNAGELIKGTWKVSDDKTQLSLSFDEKGTRKDQDYSMELSDAKLVMKLGDKLFIYKPM